MSTQHTTWIPYISPPIFANQKHWCLDRISDKWSWLWLFLRGLKEGFHIVSRDSNLPPREVTNYKSTTGDDVRNKVEKAMHKEIQRGNYIITTE